MVALIQTSTSHFPNVFLHTLLKTLNTPVKMPSKFPRQNSSPPPDVEAMPSTELHANRELHSRRKCMKRDNGDFEEAEHEPLTNSLIAHPSRPEHKGRRSTTLYVYIIPLIIQLATIIQEIIQKIITKTTPTAGFVADCCFFLYFLTYYLRHYGFRGLPQIDGRVISRWDYVMAVSCAISFFVECIIKPICWGEQFPIESKARR